MSQEKQQRDIDERIPGKVYRAGMICYYIDGGNRIKMLFMQPSDTTYGGNKFQLAKGRVDTGESHRDAAIREAKEEVGLFEGNMVEEPHHVGRFLGRTDVYVVKVFDDDMFGEPADETAETRWMTIEEFMVDGRPLHRPVVQECYDFILKLESAEEE